MAHESQTSLQECLTAEVRALQRSGVTGLCADVWILCDAFTGWQCFNDIRHNGKMDTGLLLVEDDTSKFEVNSRLYFKVDFVKVAIKFGSPFMLSFPGSL